MIISMAATYSPTSKGSTPYPCLLPDGRRKKACSSVITTTKTPPSKSARSPAERAEFALDAGQKIFPAYRSSFESAFSVAWHRVQYNLGGWAEWNDKNRASAYPVLIEGEGRVLLAGEHLSYLTGWQA